MQHGRVASFALHPFPHTRNRALLVQILAGRGAITRTIANVRQARSSPHRHADRMLPMRPPLVMPMKSRIAPLVSLARGYDQHGKQVWGAVSDTYRFDRPVQPQ
jgi:hypothetical protein